MIIIWWKVNQEIVSYAMELRCITHNMDYMSIVYLEANACYDYNLMEG